MKFMMALVLLMISASAHAQSRLQSRGGTTGSLAQALGASTSAQSERLNFSTDAGLAKPASGVMRRNVNQFERIPLAMSSKATGYPVDDIPADERADLLDSSGAIVGSIVFGDNTLQDVLALNVFEPYTQYFYVDGKKSELVNEIGKTEEALAVYNDEYEVALKATTVQIEKGLARVRLDYTVTWGSDNPEDADYPTYSSSAYVILPIK